MDDQHNLAQYFYMLVDKHRDMPMLGFMGQTYSYQKIFQYAEACAVYLQSSLQLKPGDRIAIMLPNIPQFGVVFWAAQLCGLVTVPLNPLYTQRELQAILKQAQPRAIVVLDVQYHQVIPFTKDMHVLTTQLGDLLPRHQALLTQLYLMLKGKVSLFNRKARSLKKVLHHLRGQKIQPVHGIGVNQLAMLQFTGGTTGEPKAVMLSHKNILANMEQAYVAYQQLGIKAGASQLLVLPMFHIYGLSVFLNGCSQGAIGFMVPDPKNTAQVVKIIKKTKPCIMPVINTLMVNLLNHKAFIQIKDFSWLAFTISGGMATQKTVADQWQKITGCVVNQGYGLSETSPIIAVTNFKQGDVFEEQVGHPVKGTEIRILDEAGMPVSIGEPGELYVKGPQVMQGYWKKLDETMAVLQHGWFKTGDIVVQNTQGCLSIVDRSKDMVVISGFNVYPSEVEKVLLMHPNIIEAAVIGEFDAHDQEFLKAYCVTLTPMSQDAFKGHCRQFLAAYKVPCVFVSVKTIPKSQIGKVLKRALKQAV